MFKVSFFLYKHPYLSYFILLLIFNIEGYIADNILPIGRTKYIIIIIITILIYYYYLDSDCLTRPLKDFTKDSNVALYKNKAEMMLNIRADKQDDKYNKFNMFLCSYFENGPSKKLIEECQNLINSNAFKYQKAWYLKIIFYMYIEIEDYDNAKKNSRRNKPSF